MTIVKKSKQSITKSSKTNFLEKIKETRLKFSQGSATVLKKMENYQEARVRLTNTKLNKLKSVVKRQEQY